MSQITINGVALDPAAPELARRALVADDASCSCYLLVQTKAPLVASEKAQLARLDVQLLEYVPDDTYVCRYDPADLTPVRALPFVAWANPYLTGFKIAPALHASADGSDHAHLLELEGTIAAAARSSSQLVDIVMHRDVDPTTVTTRIGTAAGIDPADLKTARGKFRLRVQADRLAAIAAIDQVRHIEPVAQKQLWNNVARRLLCVDPVQEAGRFEGADQIIAVCDTGFDKGDPLDLPTAFAGRVLKLVALGRPTASDPNGHGTHVCGSVLGDGTSTAYGRIRGTAPRAKLIMQSILDARGDLSGLPDDLYQLLQPAYADGARVHSNSWGDTNNAYTQECHDVDSFVWTYRDLVVVIAAGNGGIDDNADGVIDLHSVGSPGTARNCITIGASESSRIDCAYVEGARRVVTYGEGWPQDYPVAPIYKDRLASSDLGIAAFSGRGPTRDGQIKPDLVAPGTGILSTRSRAVGVGTGWGLSDDPNYLFDGGTSMATPLVAGCAAVVREYLISKGIDRPSAALVKAMLINGADSLPGQYTPSETGTVPNAHQGFGRVNLAGTLIDPDLQVFRYWDEGTELDTGEKKQFKVTLTAHAKRVKVTLVWTDAPGETLQNDLDLTVVASGVTRLGNAAAGSLVSDRKNNVEQIELTGVPAGLITIKIHAFRAVRPQSFALVARATN